MRSCGGTWTHRMSLQLGSHQSWAHRMVVEFGSPQKRDSCACGVTHLVDSRHGGEGRSNALQNRRWVPCQRSPTATSCREIAALASSPPPPPPTHMCVALPTRGLPETQQADEDVLPRVLVGEEGLPALVRGVVPPHQLRLVGLDRVVDVLQAHLARPHVPVSVSGSGGRVGSSVEVRFGFGFG